MLFSLRHKAEEEAADLPALRAMAERAVESILHGEHRQRKAGSGEQFWQFREYTPSDRPQDIDWRQSAKSDGIYTRQKEWQTTQTAVFWANKTASMDFRSKKALHSKEEAARILTLALALLMTRAGEQIGWFGALRTGRSELAIERLGDRLLDQDDKTASLPDYMQHRLTPNSSFIMTGDFLEPIEKTREAFKKLSAQSSNGLAIQILDPAELDLPYSGRVIFENAEKDNHELINHVSSIRAEYKSRIENHIHEFQNLCRECHWDYALHRTDKPVKDTLACIWETLALEGTLEGML